MPKTICKSSFPKQFQQQVTQYSESKYENMAARMPDVLTQINLEKLDNLDRDRYATCLLGKTSGRKISAFTGYQKSSFQVVKLVK